MKLVTVREACERLRISRASFYKLVQRGSLPLVKIGGKSLITEAAIEALVQGATEWREPGRQAWAEYYRQLLGLGLTSLESRDAVVSPGLGDFVPAAAGGSPTSALVHEEREAR